MSRARSQRRLAGDSLERREMMAALVGLTSAGALVRFDSSDPTTIASTVAVQGLAANESLVAIDFRSATGQLYGISDQSKLYVVNTTTGQTALVGQPANGHKLVGSNFGATFDPDADRLRVVSDADQNFRLHPNRGVITGNGTKLKYTVADPHKGDNPNVVAATYVKTNNTSRAMLYGIDSRFDTLVREGAPAAGLSANSGQLTTIGALGIDTTGLAGLDFASDGTVYAALNVSGETASRLYTINVATGQATELGRISGDVVQSLAVAPDFTPLPFAATDDQWFVDDVYTDVLGRRADPDGMSFWTGELARGLNRARLAASIHNTAEARARLIDHAFMSHLGREADPAAKGHWMAFLSRGGSARQLELALVSSDEFYAARCHGAVDEFIDAMYEDVLQRDADSAGRDYFRGLLASGGSRSAAVQQLQLSDEGRRFIVQSLFQWHLSRDADSAAVEHFSTLLRLGLKRETIAALLASSDEYSSL